MSSRPPRTPEESLVLLVARRDPDRQTISDYLERVDDWDRLVRLAGRHGLLPLMAAHLDGMAIPTTVSRQLAVARIQTEHKNQITIAELLRFTGALRNRGVASVVFKGPAAALRYYGHVSLREYADFDMLVAPESLAIVDELLHDLDYMLIDRSAPGEHVRNRRTGREESWVTKSGAVLDLHWSLYGFLPFRLTPDELLRRSIDQELNGSKVRTLSDEDHLIAMAAHAGAHVFERLEWVTLVGEAMNRPQLDWDAVVERSRRARCCTVVAITCQLAARVLEYPLPGAARCLPVRMRSVDRVVARAEREFFLDADQDWRPLKAWWAMLPMFDSPVDAFNRSVRKIFAPGRAEARAMPLPPRWRFLYLLFRPLRLGHKYMRLMWRAVRKAAIAPDR